MRIARRCLAVLPVLSVLPVIASCNAPSAAVPDDPPQVMIGERLFLETRFAQFFAAHSTGVNQPLVTGDPVMDTLETTGAPRSGPFAGKSMNCRQCHLVDESPHPGAVGVRTYADFARRSPIPDRGDGHTHTPRNSPALVEASAARDVPLFLHFDGQFATPEDLVEGTLTGRNFGWLPDEAPTAVAHVARVIREDDGTTQSGSPCGGLAYATLLAGTSASLPEACRLPAEDRLDVSTVGDDQILNGVARLVADYMRSLAYLRDAGGGFVGSPYDRFLILNGLPRQRESGESGAEYARRLRAALDALVAPKWLDNPGVLAFEHHDQRFSFGAEELAGLRIFLAEPAGPTASEAETSTGGVGNCVACHAPPTFTDLGFHNNGVAQVSYDTIWGPGAFSALAIPGLAQRQADPAASLPPSALYPTGSGMFASPPSADQPGYVDLGLWNVFADDAFPIPQATVVEVVRQATGAAPDATTAQLLPSTIAAFKTPTLRDLGQSAPFFHDGMTDTLEDAVAHYLSVSSQARAGGLRNGAPEMSRIALLPDDVGKLAAFLRALSEDYE